jgi:hypothetical protein
MGCMGCAGWVFLHFYWAASWGCLDDAMWLLALGG